MTDYQKSLLRNQIVFTNQIIQREIAELEREQRHLQIKGSERELTGWEVNRMVELVKEISALVREIGKFELEPR